MANPSYGIPHPRRGLSLLELFVASALLSALFAVIVPLLSHVRIVQTETQRRRVALHAVANVMERVAVLTAQQRLDEASLSEQALPKETEQNLPESRLQTELVRSGEVTTVTISLSWTNDAGDRVPPVELTAWFPTRRKRGQTPFTSNASEDGMGRKGSDPFSWEAADD